MTSEGLTVKDILPIPDNLEILNDDNPIEEPARSLTDEPTLSHSLAVEDHDEKGQAQIPHNHDVKDLGWNDPDDKMSRPLVGGLPNEELWMLLRRFNKVIILLGLLPDSETDSLQQMYDVKAISTNVPGNLDLNIADEDEFSPDKLRAGIERLYMTVIVGLMGAWKHLARLRSWRESRRTAAFCAAYFIAWTFDYLVPLFCLTLVTLITYPPSREILFPPAPLALVDAKTGGLQKPKAGVLGSTDSATGAPENFKGEAVEAEANNLVNSIASVAISSASGKHPQNDPPGLEEEGNSTSDHVPDPTAIAAGAGDARANAGGKEITAKQDKAKVPMETAIWNKLRPTMHGISDICDTWEEFANALSPTPPFPRDVYRLRLAAIVVPILAASIFITSYAFLKATWFGIGFGFFGDPIIQPGLRWLDTNYPNWQKLLELRNTVLKGVPTNAQLTLTLLRVAENNKAPLPPPPRSGQPPPDEPVDVSDGKLRAAGSDSPLNASEDELKDAMEYDPTTAQETTGADVEASKEKSHSGKASHVLKAVKGSIRGSIETALGADHVKARVGSEHSKRRLGVVPANPYKKRSGPVAFKCRYHGKRGHCYISETATTPCVAFSLEQSIATEGIQGKGDKELRPLWSIQVADIKEMKKHGGLGWKSKLVVGWALSREVADGLELVDRLDNHYIVTAMVLRDELFNRLIAMGGQKWECW